MLDFRKVLLAAAVAGLGLVSTASAQVACTALAPVAAATGVRNEGITEQITPLSINTCTGTLNNGSFSVTLNFSVPVTNVQLSGQTTGTYTDAVAVASGFAATDLTATGTSTPGSSSITFSFSGGSTVLAVPVAPALAATIKIYNVRVNVSALAANAAVTVTAAGSASLVAPTTTATVAYATTSLTSKFFNGFGSIALCNVATTDVNVLGAAGFKEAFVNALTTDADENTIETGATGYGGSGVTPTTTGSSGVGTLGIPPVVAGTLATGSRIAVTFGNLAAGVTYYLPTVVTNGTLTLTMISGPTVASGAGIVAGATVGTATNKGNTGAFTLNSVYGFVPTAGTFTAYYSVTADTSTAIDGMTFASIFGVAVPSLSTAGPTYPAIELFAVTSSTAVAASGAPTVAIYLVGNSAGYAQFLTPASPTVTTASASATTTITVGQAGVAPGTALLTNGTGQFSACNTTMVFPYLINTGGYDTGIALTNAGLGSSVSGNTVTATSGACTLSLWGAASLNGTAVTPFTLAPITIAAGQVSAFTLSGALAGTANASGFAGYAVASCNFQGGHGFAFITDGFGTTPGKGLSQGYLAPILSDIYNSAYATINSPL